jgi:replication factor C subunit 3/5
MDDYNNNEIPVEDINAVAAKCNIQFLVDKYIPKNISDIFDEETEYLKELNKDNNINLSKNTNKFINSDSWLNSNPSKCYFHKEIFHKLKKISEDDGMPHIIFYGNPGTGKKTMINLFLEMIFDKSIYKMDDSKYTVISSGNIENEVFVKQSDHHIIIEPNNNNFDRYLIQDIVKEYARRYPLCIFEKSRNFKMVQINNLDNLSYYAQTSLRRTIEKYSRTCRFVMWCYSLSKVIEPLRSRCLCIHVPTQTSDDIVEWTFNIASIEKININFPVLNYIVDTSNGNLKDILWKLDLFKYCGKVQNGYQKSLILLINEIVSNGDIQVIRDYIYKMMITNISSNIIIKDILNIILTKLDEYPDSKNKSTEIIDYASDFEYRLSKGRRDIIHIEAFILNVMNVLNK